MQKVRERRIKGRCFAIVNQPKLDKLKPNFYDLVTVNLLLVILAKEEREPESIINLKLAKGERDPSSTSTKAKGEERRNRVQMKRRKLGEKKKEG